MTSNYFPAHAHSEYSWIDGIGTVEQMVQRVAKLGQPALALTDHGVMAGCLKLYKYCKQYGILPFPGEEFYLVGNAQDEESRKFRWHIGILALDLRGYQALVRLSSRSHQRDRFYKKPLIDLSDLAALSTECADSVAVLTGCKQGMVMQARILGTPTDALTMVKKLTKWFPNLFVELQWHGGSTAEEDAGYCVDLMNIANSMGLPVVLGQDSHYCEAHHQVAHDLMKEIGYYGVDADDYKFDGGPYHLASTMQLRKNWSKAEWDMINAGHGELLALHDLILPALEDYKFYVPDMGSAAQLKRKVTAALGSPCFTSYEQRMNHELKVIESKGYWSYFLLWERMFAWARKEGIFFNVRGSANGSLVCYLLNITNVDPIQWGLSFDRFLSMDRQKPPDIDVDIESHRRAEFIEHVKTFIPDVTPIGTYGRFGITEGLEEEDTKGSIIVKYHAAHRKLDANYGGQVAKEDWPAIEMLAELNARQNAGVHAAGYVLPSKELPLSDYLPTMLIASSNTTATQMVMEDVESAGYVKGDFLGLRSLHTMRLAIEALGKDPVTDGMAWIPDDDPDACKVLRSGHCEGIFQFEGYTTQKGAQEMKVANTLDAILCLALYRPAMMTSGMTDRYLLARKRKQPDHLHPQLDGIMKETWGVPVFQEQVIEIMRRSGLGADDLNDVLKAVKASNDKIAEYAVGIFARVHPVFIRRAITILDHCTKADAERIWATVMKFSDYGFNRAHATAYGLLGYRMAYLKAHHPAEFMAALLAAWSGRPKETIYHREAKRLGLSIGRADINKSDVLWSAQYGTLRRGLLSIKGIGEPTAQAIVLERNTNGPYTSVENLIERTGGRVVTGGKDWAKKGTLNGNMAVLRDAGALGVLGVAP